MEETNATLEEIAKTQGTRLQDLPPWMTYAASFDEKLDPKLEEEVKIYSEKRHEKSSNQNEEEFCKQKEFSDGVAKQYAWLDPREYVDEEARIGRVMSHAEFITRLRKLGIRCWYIEHPHRDKLTLLVCSKSGDLEVGCWVQYGLMSELSVSRFDEHGVFVNEKYRGWRTCLMNLLLRGYITEEQINKVFPEPRHTQAFNRYNQFMHDTRSTGELG